MSVSGGFIIPETPRAGTVAPTRAKEKGGHHEDSHPEVLTMLHENMILPAKAGKEELPPTLFSDANAQRTRRAEAWLVDRLSRARTTGIFTEVVTLDPVLAGMLLQQNAGNRTLKPTKLVNYEADIKAGRWALNGESIKVALDGQLNDGQHRCWAVINAGKPIKTLMTFGLPRETRLTLDQGAVRTAGDYLSMDGVANGNHVAAVAAMVCQLRTHGEITRDPSKRPTKAQIQETYHSNPGILDSIHAVPKKGAQVVGGISVLAFCHYLFAQYDRRAADAFIDQLVKGYDLKERDPIHTARQRLIQTTRLWPHERAEVVVRAWNATRTRRTLKTVVINGRLPPIER